MRCLRRAFQYICWINVVVREGNRNAPPNVLKIYIVCWSGNEGQGWKAAAAAVTDGSRVGAGDNLIGRGLQSSLMTRSTRPGYCVVGFHPLSARPHSGGGCHRHINKIYPTYYFSFHSCRLINIPSTFNGLIRQLKTVRFGQEWRCVMSTSSGRALSRRECYYNRKTSQSVAMPSNKCTKS